ncbi:hypothetical protein [Gemmatimonas sp.]|uniref:hypothetical protein n=1 Tax=Gemmatimonas sp. TaxID=1962908 RepID=UPI003983310B
MMPSALSARPNPEAEGPADRPPSATTDSSFVRSAEQVTLSASILSVSAALVGVCLTVIGLIRVIENLQTVRTIEDNLLAIDSLVFLGAATLAYGAMRSRTAVAYRRFERAADALFLVGLTCMSVVCVVIAYELS